MRPEFGGTVAVWFPWHKGQLVRKSGHRFNGQVFSRTSKNMHLQIFSSIERSFAGRLRGLQSLDAGMFQISLQDDGKAVHLQS